MATGADPGSLAVRRGDVPVVVARGDIDAATAPRRRDRLSVPADRGAPAVVVDPAVHEVLGVLRAAGEAASA